MSNDSVIRREITPLADGVLQQPRPTVSHWWGYAAMRRMLKARAKAKKGKQ